MNITKPRRSRHSNRPSREALQDTSDRVAVWTNSWHNGPLKVKSDRLSDDEAASLATLTTKAAKGRGIHPSLLDKRERRQFEGLVEKGAGLAPGWFDQTRESAGLSREVRRLVAAASRPKQPTVAEEDRLVRLLFSLVQRRALHIDRLGIFIYLLGQILAYEAQAPGAWMEGEGDQATLVLNRNIGLGANHDPTSNATVRWEEAAEQLQRNGLLVVDRSGGSEVRVRMGPLTLRALGRTS